MTAPSTWLAGWLAPRDVSDQDVSVWWRACADDAICYLARQRASFTLEDARELGVPAPPGRRGWAHVMSAASTRGWVVRVAYVPARSGATRPVSIWGAGPSLPMEALPIVPAPSAGMSLSLADAVAAAVAATALVAEVLAAQLVAEEVEREASAASVAYWTPIL